MCSRKIKGSKYFYEDETFLDEKAEKSCQDVATFMEDTVEQPSEIIVQRK
jgi:hypothetical protein